MDQEEDLLCGLVPVLHCYFVSCLSECTEFITQSVPVLHCCALFSSITP